MSKFVYPYSMKLLLDRKMGRSTLFLDLGIIFYLISFPLLCKHFEPQGINQKMGPGGGYDDIWSGDCRTGVGEFYMTILL